MVHSFDCFVVSLPLRRHFLLASFVCGIAALSVTFFLAVKKKVTKEKLPAAPDSLNVSALGRPVVAEPDDAGFLRLTVVCAFA
jgi:hypothetical protein